VAEMGNIRGKRAGYLRQETKEDQYFGRENHSIIDAISKFRPLAMFASSPSFGCFLSVGFQNVIYDDFFSEPDIIKK
jgi:hypothetical protein